MKRSRLLPAVALLSSAVMLMSCSETVKDEGSSGDNKKTNTTESTTKTTRGITDDSIKVGGIQYGVYFGDAELGVQARIDKANADGGVHGRKIDFIGSRENDNDPTKDQDLVKALVEQEEVFALLPVMSGTFGAADYVVQNNVPTFGYGINPAFCENDVAFGITGCVSNPSMKIGSNALGTALADMFDGDTDKTISFLAEDNDAGRGGLVLLAASVEDKGFKVPYSKPSLPAPPEQPGDVSPFVSELLSSDNGKAPDIIYLQATLSGAKIADGLQKGGFEGMIITPSYSALLLGAPGYNDIYVNTQFGMDPTVPANKEMLEAVHAINPEQKMSLALVSGYRSADLFIKALEATGKDLTVESFLKTLNDDFTYSADGVVGESKWPDNHNEPVPCSVMTKIENNEFKHIQKLECGKNIKID